LVELRLTALAVPAIDRGMLTAEDVIKRIAAECAYVDDRGGVGIRLKPAAAIVREYGEQFRSAGPVSIAKRRPRRPVSKTPKLL
jgi:hypothetical protein